MTYLLILIASLSLAAIRWSSAGLVYAGSTLLWLILFQYLTISPAMVSKWRQTGIAFMIGYMIRHFGVSGLAITDIALLSLLSAAIFSLFLLNGRLVRKWNSVLGCLLFPSLWMTAYKLLVLCKLPSAMRIDNLFFDWKELIQTEALIGADGLSYLILLAASLFAFGICRWSLYRGDRAEMKSHTAPRLFTGSGLLALSLSAVIMILLLANGYRILNKPNKADFSIKCAYTTGPYEGDFLHFTAASYETCLESMNKACEAAAKQNAEILVFNEEAFSLPDTKADEFMLKVMELAKTYRLHILYGIDIADTDDSENGKSINKLIWITKDGQFLDEYVKYHLVPAIEAGFVRGKGEISTHTVSFQDGEANVSFIICYDSNFTGYVKQIRDSAEVLFLPSWDWRAVTDLHYHICGMLPVENQLTLIKPTYDGISIAVTPYGEVLNKTDTADDGFETVHIVDLPVYKKAGL